MKIALSIVLLVREARMCPGWGYISPEISNYRAFKSVTQLSVTFFILLLSNYHQSSFISEGSKCISSKIMYSALSCSSFLFHWLWVLLCDPSCHHSCVAYSDFFVRICSSNCTRFPYWPSVIDCWLIHRVNWEAQAQSGRIVSNIRRQ